MKKISIIILLALGFISYAYSQNEVDALRYSYMIPGGTSRSNAMAGSFGALGGDASVLFSNPAGMGVYKSSDFTITPSFELVNTNATYIGKNRSDYDFGANLNNIALIGTVNLDGKSGFNNINFGFAYNRLNSFNENIIIEGVNDGNSFTDWLAARANGVFAGDLEAYDPYYSNLGYWGYVIDPTNDEETYFRSAYNRYGQTQRQMINRSGYQGEYSFSFAGNINHKLYLGATLGVQTVRYREVKNLEEIDSDNTIDEFRYLHFMEQFETRGTGVNFKIGALYSPVEWIRFGGAFHTPTFFSLKDDYETYLKSEFDSGTDRENTSMRSPNGYYDYQLNTPWRANASVGFIINKIALVNVDYEFVDYSKAKFRSDDYGFYDENENIKQNYKPTHNVKVGGEYRYGPVSFRLGFAYYGSPYKSNSLNEKAHTLVYSGGLGARFGNTYLDFAYSYFGNSKYYGLYGGYNEEIDSPFAKIKNSQNRFTVTLGFKF